MTLSELIGIHHVDGSAFPKTIVLLFEQEDRGLYFVRSLVIVNISTVALFWALFPKRPLLLILYFMAFPFYHLKVIFGQHIATAMYEKKNVIVQNATYDT